MFANGGCLRLVQKSKRTGGWGGGGGGGGKENQRPVGEVDVGVWKAAGRQPNWSRELFLERTRQENLDYSVANVCH